MLMHLVLSLFSKKKTKWNPYFRAQSHQKIRAVLLHIIDLMEDKKITPAVAEKRMARALSWADKRNAWKDAPPITGEDFYRQLLSYAITDASNPSTVHTQD